jgi:hypothetical protein
MTDEKRNPACTIPGCPCQDGPPIERCGECQAAVPWHYDSCSRAVAPVLDGAVVRVDAARAAHPEVEE